MSHTQFNLGGGLITLLTCIFVVAKIWGVIDWSWWMVFCPIWISLIMALAILISILLVALIVGWFSK